MEHTNATDKKWMRGASHTSRSRAHEWVKLLKIQQGRDMPYVSGFCVIDSVENGLATLQSAQLSYHHVMHWRTTTRWISGYIFKNLNLTSRSWCISWTLNRKSIHHVLPTTTTTTTTTSGCKGNSLSGYTGFCVMSSSWLAGCICIFEFCHDSSVTASLYG